MKQTNKQTDKLLSFGTSKKQRFDSFGKLLLIGLDTLRKNGLRSFICGIFYHYGQKAFVAKHKNSGDFTISMVSFLNATACTLKCKKCISLMQYCEKPKIFSFEETKRDIDLFFGKVDKVCNCGMTGGETFLQKDLPDILEYLHKNYRDRYSFLQVVTNATVIPSERLLSAMRRCKVFCFISDYGEHSIKLAELRALLRKRGIAFVVSKMNWFDWCQLTDGSKDNAQEIFDSCDGRACRQIVNGRLYACAMFAVGDMIGAIPYDERNSVDLSGDREVVREYLTTDVAYPGCRYCTGITLNAPTVPVAEQADKPMPYVKYER